MNEILGNPSQNLSLQFSKCSQCFISNCEMQSNKMYTTALQVVCGDYHLFRIKVDHCRQNPGLCMKRIKDFLWQLCLSFSWLYYVILLWIWEQPKADLRGWQMQSNVNFHCMSLLCGLCLETARMDPLIPPFTSFVNYIF